MDFTEKLRINLVFPDDVSTNYLPVETDIEMLSDPPPSHSKTSTWRYTNPNQDFDCDITLTVLTQPQIAQVWAFRRALCFYSPRSLDLFGLS